MAIAVLLFYSSSAAFSAPFDEKTGKNEAKCQRQKGEVLVVVSLQVVLFSCSLPDEQQ
jgi:hypothetical protein